MIGKQSKSMVISGAFIFFILIGGVVDGWLLFAASEPKRVQQSAAVAEESAPGSEEIENVGQTDEAYLIKQYGKAESLFSNCDAGLERKAIADRLACVRREVRAEKFWRDMQTAEKEVKTMLLKKNVQALTAYISCDAYDLTWYEMHCESDRRQVMAIHVNHLLGFVQQSGPKILQDAVWQQRKPNHRLFRNPRWVLRSRLVNQQFKLIGPWKHDPHPTEKGTLILLEQHLDGRIYIVGIPITGTFDE